MTQRIDLAPLLDPASVGVVGVSTRPTRGMKVVENLLASGFKGRIHPINAKYKTIADLPCHPSVADVPEPLDTLVVAIPAAGVPALLREARTAGTRSAVILSSGFGEARGDTARGLDRELREIAASGMPICGPNCLGVVNFATGATIFSGPVPHPRITGPIALISQSGGHTADISTALMEGRGLGLHQLVSCGNQVGARIDDYLAHWIDDPDVTIVAAYVEELPSRERLLELGAAAAAAATSIVLLRGGTSRTGRGAAAVHTGSRRHDGRRGSEALRDGAIIEAESLDELVELIGLLSVGDPQRIRSRVAIVSGGGGETVLGADAAVRAGLTLPRLAGKTTAALRRLLPAYATPRNPIDLTGTVYEDPAIFPGCLDAVLADPSIDLVLWKEALKAPTNGRYPWVPGFLKVIARLPADQRSRIVAYDAMAGGTLNVSALARLRELGIPALIGSDNTMRAVAKVASRNTTWLADRP
jgi:acetyltransferase